MTNRGKRIYNKPHFVQLNQLYMRLIDEGYKRHNCSWVSTYKFIDPMNISKTFFDTRRYKEWKRGND
jgi:hypothetical protein